MDAAFSFAVGDVLGISEDGIRRGIADFHNADMRQNIYGYGGISIIEDCYNASPESTRAAISLLSDYADSADEKGRKIALIGDMLELGENEMKMHRELGRYIANSGIDMLFTFGPLAENIAIGAVEGGMRLDQVFSYRDLSNPAAMGDILIESIKKNDTVLFKASRSVGAERIIEYVKSNDSKFFRTLDNI
jgi:UDP-N-acetylmuramoyl-tripeptide--D-alanyl-D-alanine ligase